MPKKNFVPLGVEYLFEQTWSCFESAAGPQKNCRSVKNRHSDTGRAGTYHADICIGVLLRDRAVNPVPVRATIVRGRTQRGDRVLFSTDVLDLFPATSVS